nr:hypothetical protein CFP56_75604 [Quercus suber]
MTVSRQGYWAPYSLYPSYGGDAHPHDIRRHGGLGSVWQQPKCRTMISFYLAMFQLGAPRVSCTADVQYLWHEQLLPVPTILRASDPAKVLLIYAVRRQDGFNTATEEMAKERCQLIAMGVPTLPPAQYSTGCRYVLCGVTPSRSRSDAARDLARKAPRGCVTKVGKGRKRVQTTSAKGYKVDAMSSASRHHQSNGIGSIDLVSPPSRIPIEDSHRGSLSRWCSVINATPTTRTRTSSSAMPATHPPP